MLHSDLKVTKHPRLQAIREKNLLANTVIQTLGHKTDGLGAKWGTKTSICK